MSHDYRRRPEKHPRDSSNAGPWTPIGGTVMLVMDEAYRVCGSWRQVHLRTGVSKRRLFDIRNYRKRCVTRAVYERICAVVDADLDDVNWYTAQELVDGGFWKDLWGQESWIDDGKKRWAKTKRKRS
jgi:hypothetical protein